MITWCGSLHDILDEDLHHILCTKIQLYLYSIHIFASSKIEANGSDHQSELRFALVAHVYLEMIGNHSTLGLIWLSVDGTEEVDLYFFYTSSTATKH